MNYTMNQPSHENGLDMCPSQLELLHVTHHHTLNKFLLLQKNFWKISIIFFPNFFSHFPKKNFRVWEIGQFGLETPARGFYERHLENSKQTLAPRRWGGVVRSGGRVTRFSDFVTGYLLKKHVESGHSIWRGLLGMPVGRSGNRPTKFCWVRGWVYCWIKTKIQQLLHRQQKASKLLKKMK